ATRWRTTSTSAPTATRCWPTGCTRACHSYLDVKLLDAELLDVELLELEPRLGEHVFLAVDEASDAHLVLARLHALLRRDLDVGHDDLRLRLRPDGKRVRRLALRRAEIVEDDIDLVRARRLLQIGDEVDVPAPARLRQRRLCGLLEILFKAAALRIHRV